MNTYTPGPWFVVETCHQMNFEDTTVCKIKFIGQEKEFFVGSKATNHGDVEATAKLIAAAPDLLEALQKMLSRFKDCDNGMIKAEYVKQLAEAAIIKATT